MRPFGATCIDQPTGNCSAEVEAVESSLLLLLSSLFNAELEGSSFKVELEVADVTGKVAIGAIVVTPVEGGVAIVEDGNTILSNGGVDERADS